MDLMFCFCQQHWQKQKWREHRKITRRRIEIASTKTSLWEKFIKLLSKFCRIKLFFENYVKINTISTLKSFIRVRTILHLIALIYHTAFFACCILLKVIINKKMLFLLILQKYNANNVYNILYTYFFYI